MKASTKRILTILGSFGLIIGSLFVYLSLVVPTYQEIQVLKAEQQAAEERLRQQTAAEEAVSRLVGQLQGLTAFRELVSLSLPREVDIPSVLNQLSGIATLSQIFMQSLSFQYQPIAQSTDALVQPIGTIRVSMSLFGNYAALKAFMTGLETNVRIIDLSTLRVDGGARPNQTNMIYNIVADIYYQS